MFPFEVDETIIHTILQIINLLFSKHQKKETYRDLFLFHVTIFFNHIYYDYYVVYVNFKVEILIE